MSGAAVLLVASATSAMAAAATPGTFTSSAAKSSEAPLSPEDLALIEQLDRTQSATAAGPVEARRAPIDWTAPAGWLAHAAVEEESLGRGRVGEAIGRTAIESLEGASLWLDARRSFIGGDSPVLRGESGHRVGLSLDGVSLHHALTSAKEASSGDLDPWMLGGARIGSGSNLLEAPWAPAGSIALSSADPRETPGIGTELDLDARSADRSSELSGAVDGMVGPLAARLSGGYADFGPLRIGPNLAELGSGHQRSNGSGRARLFGRDGDPLRIAIGFDYGLERDVARLDLGAPRIDRRREHQLALLSLFFGSSDLGGRVLLARQTFALERSPDTGSEILRREDVETLEAKVQLEAAPFAAMRFGIGGDAQKSSATFGDPIGALSDGSMLLVGGSAWWALATEHVDARLLARWASARTEDAPAGDAGRIVRASEPLGEARLVVRLGGPFALSGRLARELSMPSVADLEAVAPIDGSLFAESRWSGEIGPSLSFEDFDTALIGFLSRVDGTRESDAPDRRLGLEWRARARIGRHLGVIGSAALDAGTPGLSVLGAGGFTGRMWLRYSFESRDAFVELGLRGTTPVRTLEVPSPERYRFLRASLRAGSELGAGFRLLLMVENVLDQSTLTPGTTAPPPGLDLRVALIHAFN